MANTTFPLKERRTRCDHCGYSMAVHETHCPQCGHAAAPPSAADTDLLNRPPVTLPDEHEASAVFSPEAAAILQFLPSGLCLSLWLEQPLILGRGPLPEPEERIDLSDMGGVQHGVSRCHCLLQRRDHHLMVTDLGSTNGTYLNGELLLPHQSHILRHGDRLILGTLHLLISFSTVETDQGPAQF